MNETEAARADDVVVNETAPETFGRRLAAERARQGLSIDDIAARLRLHPRQVQAIENEALPALPPPVLRGFVRNYAKELRLDPEPLVAELGARLGPQADRVPGAEGGASATRLIKAELASRRVVVGGALAALAALAVLGWMATRSERHVAEVSPPAVKPEQAPLPSAAPPAATPTPEASKDAQPAQPTESTTTPPTAGGTNAAPPAGAAPSQGAADTPFPSTVAPTPAPAPAPFGGLRMSFRDQSWVEVTQGDGRILLSQVNAAGSEQRIDGKPPLRLVVGNAAAVSIEYKGKPVDLKPVTNADNVARVTLN